MSLEQIPLVLGAFVAIIGLGFIVDAVLPEQRALFRERRRRVRTERSPAGEALVGLGTLCLAAALIGRDTWYFGTVAVIAGAVLVALGAWLSRLYLRELVVFRGAARRGSIPAEQAAARSTTGRQVRRRFPRPEAGTPADMPVPLGTPSPASTAAPDKGTRPAAKATAKGADRELPIPTATDGRASGARADGGPTDTPSPRMRIR
jgi:hypothetical protein